MNANPETRVESDESGPAPTTTESVGDHEQRCSTFSAWGDRIRSWSQALRRSFENAVAWLRSRVRQSSLGARAMAAFHKRSSRERAIVGLLLLLFFVTSVALIIAYSKGKTSNDPEQQVVAQWLDAQLAGGTGAEFIAPRSDGVMIHFHSLRHWRILAKPHAGQFLVELGAATPGGLTASGEYRITVANVSQASGGSGLKVVQVDLYSPGAPGQ